MNTPTTGLGTKLVALSETSPPDYRRRLNRLSPMAKMMVHMFESGASGDDIVYLIASRHYHTALTAFIADSELRAAKAEFASLIHEIREVLLRDL